MGRFVLGDRYHNLNTIIFSSVLSTPVESFNGELNQIWLKKCFLRENWSKNGIKTGTREYKAVAIDNTTQRSSLVVST